MSALIAIPRRAIERMASYRPADHEETMSVAPLLQFFELVHIGDTIQSMVQVYFDKELVSFSPSRLTILH
jgi:recyclin-1